MFDRYEVGERAILVHIDFSDETEREDVQEFEMLVDSASVQCLDLVTGKRQVPHPKYFVGQGKAGEIADAVTCHGADLVIFNHALSPAQERNLEQLCQCRVLDRTSLILDIFAQRARTHEGKLQVELAQLRHLSTRLIRGWTHLERQKGGIGLRGPGETQLETDRRLVRDRIRSIERRLEKVEKQRSQGRRARHRAEVPTTSLVGYTNAGKSTLFNSLTASGVYAADQLFATLDPTLRRLDLTEVGPVILADTVGFIRHLPHDLVAAFKATLEETRQAALLLHVVDAADGRWAENVEQVNSVLDEIEADDVPMLMVCNKIDALEDMPPRIDRNQDGEPIRVWLSARTGEGLDLLRQALRERLGQDLINYQLQLPPAWGGLRSQLFRQGAVVSEQWTDAGDWLLDIRMPLSAWNQMIKANGKEIEGFIV